MPKQLAIPSFPDAVKKKVTQREMFLTEMDAVEPWTRLSALIEPHYPKVGPKCGRPLMPVEMMLRIHFLQSWYTLSDLMAEESLYDSVAMRRFGLFWADKGYVSVAREAAFLGPGRFWGVMRKAPKGGTLHPIDEDINRIIAKVRAKVEHPFRFLKRQFGHAKTRYRGQAKNRAHLFTLFALGNLFLMRRRLAAESESAQNTPNRRSGGPNRAKIARNGTRLAPKHLQAATSAQPKVLIRRSSSSKATIMRLHHSTFVAVLFFLLVSSTLAYAQAVEIREKEGRQLGYGFLTQDRKGACVVISPRHVVGAVMNPEMRLQQSGDVLSPARTYYASDNETDPHWDYAVTEIVDQDLQCENAFLPNVSFREVRNAGDRGERFRVSISHRSPNIGYLIYEYKKYETLGRTLVLARKDAEHLIAGDSGTPVFWNGHLVGLYASTRTLGSEEHVAEVLSLKGYADFFSELFDWNDGRSPDLNTAARGAPTSAGGPFTVTGSAIGLPKDCDLLMANPNDPMRNRRVKGIRYEKITKTKAETAIRECESELEHGESSMRIEYQLARAKMRKAELEKNSEALSDLAKTFRDLLERGYWAASFNYSILVRDHDACVVDNCWTILMQSLGSPSADVPIDVIARLHLDNRNYSESLFCDGNGPDTCEEHYFHVLKRWPEAEWSRDLLRAEMATFIETERATSECSSRGECMLKAWRIYQDIETPENWMLRNQGRIAAFYHDEIKADTGETICEDRKACYESAITFLSTSVAEEDPFALRWAALIYLDAVQGDECLVLEDRDACRKKGLTLAQRAIELGDASAVEYVLTPLLEEAPVAGICESEDTCRALAYRLLTDGQTQHTGLSYAWLAHFYLKEWPETDCEDWADCRRKGVDLLHKAVALGNEWSVAQLATHEPSALLEELDNGRELDAEFLEQLDAALKVPANAIRVKQTFNAAWYFWPIRKYYQNGLCERLVETCGGHGPRLLDALKVSELEMTPDLATAIFTTMHPNNVAVTCTPADQATRCRAAFTDAHAYLMSMQTNALDKDAWDLLFNDACHGVIQNECGSELAELVDAHIDNATTEMVEMVLLHAPRDQPFSSCIGASDDACIEAGFSPGFLNRFYSAAVDTGLGHHLGAQLLSAAQQEQLYNSFSKTQRLNWLLGSYHIDQEVLDAPEMHTRVLESLRDAILPAASRGDDEYYAMLHSAAHLAAHLTGSINTVEAQSLHVVISRPWICGIGAPCSERELSNLPDLKSYNNFPQYARQVQTVLGVEVDGAIGDKTTKAYFNVPCLEAEDPRACDALRVEKLIEQAITILR